MTKAQHLQYVEAEADLYAGKFTPQEEATLQVFAPTPDEEDTYPEDREDDEDVEEDLPSQKEINESLDNWPEPPRN